MVERKALTRVVVGSSPTVGVLLKVGFAGALPCSLLEIVCSDYVHIVEAKHKIAERGFDQRIFGL